VNYFHHRFIEPTREDGGKTTKQSCEERSAAMSDYNKSLADRISEGKAVKTF